MNQKDMKWSIVSGSLMLAGIMIIYAFDGGSGKDYDGNIYNAVEIGNQVWMTENLNTGTFRNGDPIPEAKTNAEWEKAGVEGRPVWCYFNNDPANGKKYGRLYNWYAVNDPRGLAPPGWHVPTNAEWSQLMEYLEGESVAGYKLKSTGGWNENGNGSNEYGFTAMPGGLRYSWGAFRYAGDYGYWLSSDEYTAKSVHSRFLVYRSGSAGRYYLVKGKGFSVRCVRD